MAKASFADVFLLIIICLILARGVQTEAEAPEPHGTTEGTFDSQGRGADFLLAVNSLS